MQLDVLICKAVVIKAVCIAIMDYEGYASSQEKRSKKGKHMPTEGFDPTALCCKLSCAIPCAFDYVQYIILVLTCGNKVLYIYIIIYIYIQSHFSSHLGHCA